MLYTVSADALQRFRLMLDTPAHEGVERGRAAVQGGHGGHQPAPDFAYEFSFPSAPSSPPLSHCARFSHPLNRGQSGFPASCDLCHRANSAVEVLRANRVMNLSTAPPTLDEPSAVQHREVFGHRLPGKGEFCRKGRRRDVSMGQDQVEDTAPRGVGDRLEEGLLGDARGAHLVAAVFARGA